MYTLQAGMKLAEHSRHQQVRKTRSKKAKPSEEPEAAPQSLPVVKEEPEAEPETVEDLPKPLSQQPELRTVPETPEGALAETAVGPQEQPGDLTQQDETRESERVEEGNIRDAGDDIILDLSQATEPSETAEKPEALSGGAQQGKVANEAPLGPIVQTPQGPHIASAATRNASSKRRAASSVRPKARISIAPGSSIAERRYAASFCNSFEVILVPLSFCCENECIKVLLSDTVQHISASLASVNACEKLLRSGQAI